MRALITRPRDDAKRVIEPLQAQGIDCVLEPLLAVHFKVTAPPVPWRRDPFRVDVARAQGLVFSSANGVRAFAAVSRQRTTPAYCVGDSTARVAREHGFRTVHSADGDVKALAVLIRQLADPARGPLVHAAGSKVAGDLAGDLAADGFTVLRHVLYEARPATALSPETVQALNAGALDAVLLFSPRTARTFAELVRGAGLEARLAPVVAYALSPAVADALAGLPFSAVRVAAAPTQEALLALIGADCAAGSPGTATPGPTESEPTKQGGFPVMTERSKNDPLDGKWEAAAPAGSPSPDATPSWGGPPAGGRPSREKPWSDASAGQRPPAPPKRRKGGGCLPMMLLLLLAFFSAVAIPGSYSWWRNQIPEPYRAQVPDLPFKPEDPDVTALQQRASRLASDLGTAQSKVSSLEDELAAVRKLAENAGVTVDLTGPLSDQAGAYLYDQIRRVQSRVDTLSTSMVTPSNILSLSDRVTDIEKIARQTQTRRSTALALLLSVAQIREAADRGESFLDQLRTVEAIVGDQASFLNAMEPLVPLAPKGVASRAGLRAGFAEMARAVTKATAITESDSWVDRTVGALSTVVLVRRTDEAAEQPTPLVLLARAEKQVHENDLAGAKMILEGLEGAAAEAARPWMDAVANRLVAEAALSDLTSLAVAEVGAARATEPGSPTEG
ncbi:uroporphyrinogen-III synthase [Pararhodospirillum oryzae]|uniref:Uroporphyrinogen-III synthase n=1 Tax=Pararhodospirillum oryzae TaxID=478448 RepID=A0A512HBM4_9PROT|nr:uroporphyrinogen-III synthase [Pararhodospirillum oryzae]GEO82800.1 uroporphyrinogen III methyltransferase [Pararhodospirillum oryzae]